MHYVRVCVEYTVAESCFISVKKHAMLLHKSLSQGFSFTTYGQTLFAGEAEFKE